MSTILKQNKKSLSPRAIPRANPAVRLILRDGDFAQLQFKSGAMAQSVCIGCADVPCIEYSDKELIVTQFQDFPADLNREVCPTLAISLANARLAPTIDPNRCIGCGLCAARCPVGAIKLAAKLGAVVSDKVDDQNFPLAKTSEEVNETRGMLTSVKKEGVLLTESDGYLSATLSRIESIGDVTTQFPNHLSRNLLLGIGIEAAMRRRGDVNLRMDLVLSNGVGEVEFMKQALLDSPRNVLDNIAVVVSRYGTPMTTLIPLIVSIGLPNQRGEYWQVINDAATVLNVKIRSLTVGALLILLWSRKTLRFDGDMLYTRPETFSIREDVERFIGRKLKISAGLLAQLESSK